MNLEDTLVPNGEGGHNIVDTRTIGSTGEFGHLGFERACISIHFRGVNATVVGKDSVHLLTVIEGRMAELGPVT